ncbi:putative mitochondrial inner membrane protease subunit [Tripterygium wilfordii]|uniref:Mitochondrial inner membrane protease subunit 2 n=1 Tax=Tripterygium wilfordii TaxID=458696 RepID=A0A7J7DMS3_TRIWF|nr:mitochondrial inner membrane protease subunit 2-like [Tripterygium wilfordii]KAF5747617.1 putative mitochondrial inner membrane protease subunit [Tripterygium wilfordii]
MGTRKFLWDVAKKYFTVGLITFTISDYASVIHVRGASMTPTFNPETNTTFGSLTDDMVLVEKFCLTNYKFSRGDVVVFSSPSNYKEKHIKRIIGLPGDWIGEAPYSYDAIKVPEGHCWVEGDNPAFSLDSRAYGPVPLGLVRGRVTHIVWPPQRIGDVNRIFPQDRLSPN